MEYLQQPRHKIFDFVAYIDWFQGIKCPEMAFFDQQNQYSRDCRMYVRQSLLLRFNAHLSTCTAQVGLPVR